MSQMNLRVVGRTIPSRRSDPETSHRAYREVAVLRAGTQRAKLLIAYGAKTEIPLIDEEAMVLSGVSPRSCWWKRCSELRADGLIEWVPLGPGVMLQKLSTVNEWCNASVITSKGLQALAELEGPAS